ncbi:MAG: capsular biosynthesis protein [Burkholderiales bacterium]|nr:capsular biosynthesis protein [Burkholderiales bacterium]
MAYPYRVAVQISMYPMDVRHARHLLAHQLRVWGPMVDRFVVTIDVHRSRAGRYRGAGFDENLAALRAIVDELRTQDPRVSWHEVDYRPEARREVANTYFGRDDIPVKAWDGGPFYAYFHGLLEARARYVVHFDGDMLFGGASRQWVEEAVRLLNGDADVLLASPLPGPPREDGRIFGHGAGVERLDRPELGLAYRFQHASTRVFVIDQQKLREKVGVLPLTPPVLASRIKSHLLGNPPIAREAEVILGEVLREHGLYRVDFLGTAPGMWSLHPPYRSDEFYRRLPELIAAVESGDVPEAQRGDYDMNDSMIDWSVQRQANRRSRRLWRLLKDRLNLS